MPRRVKKVERIRILKAHECPPCADCGEPFCVKHQAHYAECDCVGPFNAEEEGWKLIEIRGRLYGERPVKSRVDSKKRQA